MLLDSVASSHASISGDLSQMGGLRQCKRMQKDASRHSSMKMRSEVQQMEVLEGIWHACAKKIKNKQTANQQGGFLGHSSHISR